MPAREFIPIPPDCKTVVSISTVEERAWERWRLAILRFRHDPTAAHLEAVRHARNIFEAITGEAG
jgi:hypothetical protein